VRSTPVVYFAFDLLYLDGYDLCGVPLEQRRELLEQVLTPSATVRLSEAFPDAGESAAGCGTGERVEGIIAKHARSTYETRRSRDWMKIKITTEQEFVIGGSRSRRAIAIIRRAGAGVNRDGGLHWVGNTGTGFDQKLLAQIHARLLPLVTSVCPFAERPKPDRGMTWIKPDLVCQVRFTNWTPDNRLRAPVFVGMRSDVPATDVAREGRAALLPAGVKESSQTIDAHSLKFTNVKKLYYPDDGVTKGDVLNYYDAVADLLFAALEGSAAIAETLSEWHQGAVLLSEGHAGDVPFLAAHGDDRWDQLRFADDRAHLLYLVNLGCIDQNPGMSRIGTLENPDFVLIDLDPQECSYDLIVEAALLVKKTLDRAGFDGVSEDHGRGWDAHLYSGGAHLHV